MSELGPSYALSAQIGPVILGQTAAILLYGVLLSVFADFLSSKAWTRATWPLRIVVFFVVAATTASVGLGINDIWFYSTIVSDDVGLILGGTTAQCVEPAVLGAIAFVVQVTLVVRVAKVITLRYARWAFIAVCFSASILASYGAAAMTVWSVSYHNDPTVDLSSQFSMSWAEIFELWLWTSAGVDLLITLIYIIALRKRLAGGTETTDSVLRLIILCAVRTAAYTTVFAITSSILTRIFGLDNFSTYLIPYAFFEPLPPLYALSLFTTLSVGDSIVDKLGDPNLRSSGQMSGSNLPRFFVSDAPVESLSVGGGGGRSTLGADMGGGTSPAGRNAALFAHDESDAELGGFGRRRSDQSGGGTSGSGEKGIKVQVEREEKVEQEYGGADTYGRA